LYVHIVSPI